MKRLKLFFACLLMAVLSIGQMWGAAISVTTNPTTSGTFTITAAKASGQNAPIEASGCVRLYANNTLTIETSGDANITGMTIAWTKNGSKAFATVTTGTGSYTHPSAAGSGTWTGSAKEIVFNVGSSGQIQITSVDITVEEGGGSSKDDLTDEQLAWSASEAEVTFGDEPYSLPSLTNSLDLSLTYQSTAEAVATISNTGVVSIKKAGSTTIKAVFAGNEDYNAKTVSYTLTVAPAPLTPIAGGIVDEIKISDLLTSGSGYQPFSDKQASNEGHSDAVYAGKVCINSTNIQMNTIGTNASAGRSIVTTTSGGNAKRVQAFWGGTNTADRKLTVYGSNTAYAGTETAASGTKLGDLTYASGDSYAYIDITGDYAYLQIVASGAIYMSQINITWVAPDVSKVATPEISGTANFYPSTSVSISCSTDDAAIYYTTDGTAPTSASTLYEGAFTVNADGTTTVKAIAVKDGMTDSDVAERTFTKATVLTVAEAIALIPNKDDVVNDQYVAGIVCTAAPSLLSGGKLTYYISADGSETNRLQIYKGKNLNNTEFTAVSDLAIGDRVTVFGQLKNFNNTPEMNDGNYLVSKEGPAVAAPVFTPNGGGFMGETDVTITCATASSTIYYTLDGTTPSKLSSVYEDPIHLTATTTITAIAYVDEEHSIVVAKTFTLTAPMTVAEALAALDSEDPINNAAVTGIISTAPTSNPSSGKLTYYISDDGSDTDELEVYLGFGLNGASFSAKTDLQVGDEVTVFGNLTIFNSTTKEFASGSRLLAFNRPEVAVTGINLTESTAEVEKDKTVTLHASVVPANATNKTIVWSVQSGNDKAEVDANGVVTGIAAGTAVIRAASDEDATIFAECTVTVTEPAPLSPWATTYTSNVAMAHTGSGVDNGTITIGTDDPYLLVKAGASSSTGTIVVTVPKGTTDLHFHAFAWGGKTAKIELAGVENASVSEFDLAGEAGASGSGNDFTLQSDPVDQYFHVSFDAVAAETEITFSKATGSADNRFFFYGVNQEGGLILESISVSGTATALEYNEGDHFSPAGLGVTGHYSDASTAPITEGIVWAFDPDPLTEGTESVSVTATAGGFTSAAFVVDGLTVAGAAPLSPWATTYTSNVTMAHTGSGVDNGTITIGTDDPYLLVKAGASSNTGTIVVTVPKGTTDLHFHAFAWGGKTAKIELAGVENASVSEFDLAGEAGASGSGNDFTLQGDPVDQYFHVSFDAVAAVTEITFSKATGSADNRFFFYGVNQEGGAVLKSIEISGDLTNKSGYKVGDDLDLDGLTVSAIYTLNEVDQAPVDVTSLVNWSYDPLVENQTSVTITATLEDKSDDITISDMEPVASADPKIYVSTLNVNFASVEVGESVPAAETVTVTLTNVASVTATLGGTNADAFSVSPASLTESGDITISILANTDAAASYAATLTISDGEGGADDKTVNLSFEVTEPVTPEDPEVRKTWDLSIASYDANPTEEQVTWSATYVNMVADKANSTTAANNYLGGDANNRTSSRFYKNSTLTITPNAKEITSVVFTATSASYANALQGSEWTNASASVDGTTVTVTPTDGKNAIIAVVGGTCGFTAVQVNYKNIAPEPPVVDYTEVRNGLTEGWYYTMCLDKAVTAVQGASIWRVLSKAANGLDVILEEVIGTLDAGRPYIFFATANTLQVAYTGDAVGAPVTEGNNGLVGSFSQVQIANVNTNYIIYNNALYYVNSNNVYVGEHRAYLDMTGVPAYSNEPQQGNAPGRRRVTMAVHGEQTVTGIDALNAAETPVKVMINGQIFILRGEKMYDTTGRLVK